MNKRKLSYFTYSVLLLPFFSCVENNSKQIWVRNAVDIATYQLKKQAKDVDALCADTIAFPRTIENGNLSLVNGYDWTSGFFPGNLWYCYELTGDLELKKEARKYTGKLFDIQYYKGTHDLGFMMYCSYGNAMRLSQMQGDQEVLINSSKSLSSRFNEQVGLIRSWDFGPWSYPVIIDNMMNLEMLYNTTKLTGDSTYYKIANTHADRTMENHFRSDMSTYHVLSYHPEDGSIESKGTFQGYADNSSWARGQTWGLYGYVVCYRETGEKRYLEQAEKIASYIMNNPAIPEDLVPYWDYNDPKIPNVPRDASAGAITASALLELSTLVPNGNNYFKYAEKLLENLSSDPYLAKKGENEGFILKHSTGYLPGNTEIDVPLNYADYYYLEALKRYVDIEKIDLEQTL